MNSTKQDGESGKKLDNGARRRELVDHGERHVYDGYDAC
jgi:hypothetical protein